MKMCRLILGGATASLLLTGPLLAQQQEPLQLGARIRVSSATSEPGPRIGTYAGVTGSALQLSTGSAALSLPLEGISRLELSTGHSPGIVGGIVGALLGVGVGGFLGCVANQDSYGVLCGGQDDTKVIVGATLGGLAGGLAGALLFPRERWREVDLSRLGR